MSLFIFQAYTELRRRCPEGKINLSEIQSHINNHKYKICMDCILEFLHQNKNLDDEEDEINLENIKLIDFIQFCRRVQAKLPRDENIDPKNRPK